MWQSDVRQKGWKQWKGAQLVKSLRSDYDCYAPQTGRKSMKWKTVDTLRSMEGIQISFPFEILRVIEYASNFHLLNAHNS